MSMKPVICTTTVFRQLMPYCLQRENALNNVKHEACFAAYNVAYLQDDEHLQYMGIYKVMGIHNAGYIQAFQIIPNHMFT